MAFDVGTAVGYLLLDTSQWTNGLSSARSALHTFQDETATAADKFTAMGTGLSSVGQTLTTKVTVPLVGVGAAAVKTAMDFEASMSNVQAISLGSAEDMALLSDKALEMGAKTKFSASEAADAFSYMAMAGWETEDMLAGIEGIMNLAAASGENLATTSDIVTDALTAFGYTAQETDRFVDVLAVTASKANTNVSLMGESFKYVAPVAGAMGYSVEDVSVALGLMANSGIKASQAGTSLRSLLARLTTETGEAGTAMQRLNISLTDGEGNLYSFRDMMIQLRTAFAGGVIDMEEYTGAVNKHNQLLEEGVITQEEYEASLFQLQTQLLGLSDAENAQYAAMLAGQEGMAGLLAIIGASDEDFEKLINSVDNAKGTVQEMADIQLDNLKGKFTILGSTLESVGIAFGNLLAPMVESVINKLQGLLEWVNALDENQKSTIVTIVEVVAALGPLLAIIGKVSSGVGKILPLLSGAGGLGGALSALAGPIGIVIAAVAALAVAWATDFGGIREKTSEIMGSIQELIASIWGYIKSLWDNDFAYIQEVTAAFWEIIENAFSTALNVIRDIIDIFSAAFRGDWEGCWEAIKQLFIDIWEGMKEYLRTLLKLLIDIIINVAIDLKNAAKDAFQAIKDGFQEKWDAIKEWFGKVIEDPIGTIKETATSMFNAGKDMFTSLWDGVKSVWESISSWVSEKVDWIKDRVTFWQIKKGEIDTDFTPGAGGLSLAADLASAGATPLSYTPKPSSGSNNSTAGSDTYTEAPRGGNVYNFYSPEPISPTKAAQEFKRVEQELALGYS